MQMFYVKCPNSCKVDDKWAFLSLLSESNKLSSMEFFCERSLNISGHVSLIPLMYAKQWCKKCNCFDVTIMLIILCEYYRAAAA
jgi:hypothetical protein